MTGRTKEEQDRYEQRWMIGLAVIALDLWGCSIAADKSTAWFFFAFLCPPVGVFMGLGGLLDFLTTKRK